MDAFSTLWQLGVFVSVLVFGIKLGLATGLARLSKKYLAAVCAGYGGGILILSAISSNFTSQITNIINTYNSILFLIMAVIMIFAGIYTIKEYKSHESNKMKTARMIIVGPCPCYFGSILASILMAAPTVGLGAFTLSQYVALVMVLTIAISYFASNKIIGYLKTPYPILLGNFMLFLGLYFLLSSILIPNIIEVFNKSMNYMSIPSIDSLILALIVSLVIIFIGFMASRKNDFLIKF